MKRIFTLLILSALTFSMFGQIENTIDFEEGLADTAWIVFANGPSGSDADIDIVLNPNANQVNNSDSVLSFLVRDSVDRWVGTYRTERTAPVVKAARMGALLALPPWMDLDSLGFETEPARILAEAFRDYGAYVVDGTGWSVYALITEWSPEGRVLDEFEKVWGFPLNEREKDSPWGRDMDRIFWNLHVVDNNGPNSIGGGGEPLVPLAPELVSPGNDRAL